MLDPTSPTTTGGDEGRRGPLLSAISNEVVGLYRRHYGRGPTRARTVMVEDIVMCRLLDPFTTSERTLLRRGRREEVAAIRHAFQEAMHDEFVEIVERLTGRNVIAFLSDMHTDPDMVVELFFLEPDERPSDPMAEINREEPEPLEP
ncbi:MAG: DUF2294 domain-containing protein [Actinomycetota bacterium]|nr:DUF2294 domain-containing protein [Actinomycetota bacterium]